MNDHKFCFIICSNDDLPLEECLHYINHLNVPEGFEIDLLTINDAQSITEGYNEAMQSTDAKYKIYIHHDVYILNKNILSDLLSIFQSDDQIGMIGMLGYDKISTDGVMWHEAGFGNLYQKRPPYRYPDLTEYSYVLNQDSLLDAAIVDGFFMATAYDLPWNTELLKGWDFYDAFQSINFIEHGYKIAVPVQIHPWCMHDDGLLLNLNNYDQYRRLFMQIYHKYLGKTCDEIKSMCCEGESG